MLVRGLNRLLAFISPAFALLFILLWFHGDNLYIFPLQNGDVWTESIFEAEVETKRPSLAAAEPEELPQHIEQTLYLPQDSFYGRIADTHHEIFSVSTRDKKYFLVEFGNRKAINPNIIPHPTLEDTWIIVAQQRRSPEKKTVWSIELACDAVFQNGVLGCIDSPLLLPIAATSGDNCEGDRAYFNLNVGPHDARVFYGPKTPYTIYGSNSMFTCFGQWMLDFRLLVDWGFEMFTEEEFRKATELQRPAPYSEVEKNWFVFWDRDEQLYAHYDIAPKRVFAKLGNDGSVGPDLAPFAADSDDKCVESYMPKAAHELESIHQATNSLSITFCKRSDPSCQAKDSNTFIFTIFQQKSFYSFHSIYEPYVMVFQQAAPFEIFAISSKPLWIHGRRMIEDDRSSDPLHVRATKTEMFYVTSMSWKTHGQNYHGYLDDVLLISFGIEDSKSAAIDVLVGDLFVDLHLCSTP